MAFIGELDILLAFDGFVGELGKGFGFIDEIAKGLASIHW